MTKIAIGFNGACGRMGQRLIALAREDESLEITVALESPHSPLLGRDAGEIAGIGTIGVPITSKLDTETRLDVMVDFSLPEGTMAVMPMCVARRVPLVIATTGHTITQKQDISSAAHETAILLAPNMSLSVNVLFALVERAAELLKGKDFDVEIVERHHRYKKDSPSGTAVHFARIIQEVMGQTELKHGREGIVGERPRGEIGMHAIRVGDNVGEHEIIFSTLGETMELIHKGHSRDSYVRGALLAAKFLANRVPGNYSMKDVLGL